MRLLIPALALLVSLPLFAAEEEDTVTWYDVELIVFRNIDAQTTETWSPDTGVPVVAEAQPLFPPPPELSPTDADSAADETIATALPPTDLIPQAASELVEIPEPYVPLDPTTHRLTGVADSLRLSSKYEPLLHVAWTQPPLDRAQSPYLRVTLPEALAPQAEEDTATGGMDTMPEEPLLGHVTDVEPPAMENQETGELNGKLQEFATDTAEEQGPQPARPLDGKVQLSVSRYLHLDLDLLYLPENIDPAMLGDLPAATQAWTEEEQLAREQRQRDLIEALARGDITLEEAEILALEPEQKAFQGFRLNEFRRLRSREVHYFDHPAFGAIVTVTPREVPARTMDAPEAVSADVGNRF